MYKITPYILLTRLPKLKILGVEETTKPDSENPYLWHSVWWSSDEFKDFIGLTCLSLGYVKNVWKLYIVVSFLMVWFLLPVQTHSVNFYVIVYRKNFFFWMTKYQLCLSSIWWFHLTSLSIVKTFTLSM